MTIVGGLLGGLLTLRYGVMRMLFIGAVLSAADKFTVYATSSIGHDITFIYIGSGS